MSSMYTQKIYYYGEHTGYTLDRQKVDGAKGHPYYSLSHAPKTATDLLVLGRFEKRVMSWERHDLWRVKLV